MNKNLETVMRLLKALSEGKAGEELNEYYDSNVIQTEFPNLLTNKTVERNLSEIKEASLRGKQILLSQDYELINSYVINNTVIIEAIWTGRLSIPQENQHVEKEMKAFFAQIFEFSNGTIIKQRTYDCFEQSI